MIKYIAATVLAAFALGCSSNSHGHRAYTGPDYLKGPVMAFIEAGAKCKPLPRPFNPDVDSIHVEVRAGEKFNEFWYGKNEWGDEVGGYLQLLEPWPLQDGVPYKLKCVMWCDPNEQPLRPVDGIILHECGGHGNLVPSGLFDHPRQFKACYPWWRLKADHEEPIQFGTAIYGPDGQVLHKCVE